MLSADEDNSKHGFNNDSAVLHATIDESNQVVSKLTDLEVNLQSTFFFFFFFFLIYGLFIYI
jgi:hypothetical protein